MYKKCPECGAVFDGNRWISSPEETLKREIRKGYKDELCPGDVKIARKELEGIVKLEGDFLKEHKEELTHLVQRIEEQVRNRNIAARIASISNSPDGMLVETTDEHLAEKIGKEVEKAYKGELEIKWRRKDRFVRVTWRRD